MIFPSELSIVEPIEYSGDFEYEGNYQNPYKELLEYTFKSKVEYTDCNLSKWKYPSTSLIEFIANDESLEFLFKVTLEKEEVDIIHGRLIVGNTQNFTIEVPGHCLSFKNAKWKVCLNDGFINAKNEDKCFGEGNIGSLKANEDIKITFEARNPLSAIPLTNTVFTVVIYNGNSEYIEANAKFNTETKLIPGEFKLFTIDLESNVAAKSCIYTISLKTQNAIPKGGRLEITINEDIIFIGSVIIVRAT